MFWEEIQKGVILSLHKTTRRTISENIAYSCKGEPYRDSLGVDD